MPSVFSKSSPSSSVLSSSPVLELASRISPSSTKPHMSFDALSSTTFSSSSFWAVLLPVELATSSVYEERPSQLCLASIPVTRPNKTERGGTAFATIREAGATILPPSVTVLDTVTATLFPVRSSVVPDNATRFTSSKLGSSLPTRGTNTMTISLAELTPSVIRTGVPTKQPPVPF